MSLFCNSLEKTRLPISSLIDASKPKYTVLLAHPILQIFDKSPTYQSSFFQHLNLHNKNDAKSNFAYLGHPKQD